MISKEEIDRLRQYLKSKGVADPYNKELYKINGFAVSIDTDYENGVVFVYLLRDNWAIACTKAGYGLSSDNPHKVIVLGFDGLMRLIKGGELAYNNMENEWILDEL